MDQERMPMPELTEEIDDSLLELLCEDGFLSPSDLDEEDFPGHRLMLLKRAIGRGFWIHGRPPRSLSDAVRLIVKQSDSSRHWKDIAGQVKFLRAPPCCV